jgi:hypothetical protein
MTRIGWGVDGYGRKWPVCDDCGATFGQMDPLDVVHECPSENLKSSSPDSTDSSAPIREGNST